MSSAAYSGSSNRLRNGVVSLRRSVSWP